MSLSKEHQALKFDIKYTRQGATLLKTTILKIRDSILKIKELENKPVNINLMSPPIRNLRYVITNVLFQIPEFYFQETYGFMDVKRIIKGKEKTRSVIFTSTQISSNGVNSRVLQDHDHTTLSIRTSTMFPMPSLKCVTTVVNKAKRTPQLTRFAAQSRNSQNV